MHSNSCRQPAYSGVASQWLRHALVLGCGLGLAACAGPLAIAVNRPLSAPPVERSAPASGDGTAIVLAFSGGGARSAAFGYGVLSELAERRSGQPGRSLADEVVLVSGVSGGAILAAYVALHGPQRLADFRRDFLERDVEAALHTSFTPANLLRAYQGGVNDLTGLPAWLDAHLYGGATFADLGGPRRPRLLVHATDLYNRAPFIFDRRSFAALCSDVDRFPLSHAVAASAAVPVVFAPVVLRNYSHACPVARPASGDDAAGEGGSLVERDYRAALGRYRSEPDLSFLKLYDGGLVDGLGTQSLVHRMHRAPPAPLTAAEALRLGRIVFIVADASTRIGGDMSRTEAPPNAVDAIVGAADAMIDATSRHGVDALRREARAWRDRLVRWRCARADATPACSRLTVEVIRVALADIADRSLRRRILGLHNRLSLGRDDVTLIAGLGRRLLAGDPTFHRLFGGHPRGGARLAAR